MRREPPCHQRTRAVLRCSARVGGIAPLGSAQKFMKRASMIQMNCRLKFVNVRGAASTFVLWKTAGAEGPPTCRVNLRKHQEPLLPGRFLATLRHLQFDPNGFQR